ncbi:VOC family protein [Falsiroseomonas selenitidurans]|uniref:VOC family protein n=1 Tax=Falsiroseomonas selenitidurans TaxID=2716335 RepID=A0ABX1ECM6_9PROT|nr:VOC family protein [Falsiroseomonas selenitidurans]NKC33642.1 VOC family protein [Falsiroseomonas selenitidurans]
MPQQISVITLGITDAARSRRFYGEGFGGVPVHETPEIVFYQMNGLVLGTWLRAALEADMQWPGPPGAPAGFALGLNVGSAEAVDALLRRLEAAGGRILRPGDAPPHGHPWEIAWNPAWPIDAEGRVTFAI